MKVKKIRAELCRRLSNIDPHESADMIKGRVYELRNLLSFLDTIEAEEKEVNIDNECRKYFFGRYHYDTEGVIICRDGEPLLFEDLYSIAHHFYELGYNSKK